MSKWFCATSTGAATGAARCDFFLLESALVSWSSAIDENSEQKDLHGLDRWSVIPYIHERMKLYCSSVALPV
jgi:hypothetical protein